jgi:hypothetical protein
MKSGQTGYWVFGKRERVFLWALLSMVDGSSQSCYVKVEAPSGSAEQAASSAW